MSVNAAGLHHFRVYGLFCHYAGIELMLTTKYVMTDEPIFQGKQATTYIL